jgi:hypothetical protein
MHTSIEFDGFEDMPALRAELVAFITQYCAEMTLAEARECFGDAFLNTP